MGKRRKRRQAYSGCPHCDSMERPIVGRATRFTSQRVFICPSCKGSVN